MKNATKVRYYKGMNICNVLCIYKAFQKHCENTLLLGSYTILAFYPKDKPRNCPGVSHS